MGEGKIIIGALPIGAVIRSARDSYRVEAVIGSGGFGITYKVIRLSDGAYFAMKEYFPSTLCERGNSDKVTYLKTNAVKYEEGVRNFITEAKRLDKQNISHPNIISVEEVFKANDTAYYTMDFINGFNLRQYVRKHHNRPLTLEQAMSVMRPILQAVALIHKSRMAHYDIKHDNILLTEEEDGSLRPVLIDFGQAKHYDKKGNATSTLTNAGCSDGFSPQEQYLGLDKFTPQADIYAICATMLYLLSAKQPPKSSDISTTYIESVLPAGISLSVKRALINGLRKDKSDRTQSVEKLAEELGIDITTPMQDGSVTRLLNVQRKRKFDYSRIILPAVGIAVLGGIILGVRYWSSSIQHTSQPELVAEEIVEEIEPQSIDHKRDDKDELQEIENPIKDQPSHEGNPTPVESNDEKFLRAQRENNFNELLSLAKSNYVKAYYPVAIGYYNRHNLQQAEIWAKKAISANVNSIEAKSLIDKINPPKPEDDELFAKATTISDFKVLADRGYSKAYAPLADKYFSDRNYSEANKYAKKALSANIGKQQAIKVIDKLDVIGYYDNGENGGKPEY